MIKFEEHEGQLFRMLEEPVEEGSRWWALYQMMQGKKVCHHKSPSIMYCKHAGDIRRQVRYNCVDYMSASAWLNGADKNGWQIYKEPKPLLAEAKVGDLVRLRNGSYSQIVEVEGTSVFKYQNPEVVGEVVGDVVALFWCDENGDTTRWGKLKDIDIIHTEPLAPEGSAEWALQMWKLGNDIRNETGVVLMADYESDEIRVKHLVDVFPSGWQLYEPEPEPEPKERPLRNLILRAKEQGMNIRTWYQDLIFTPESLTSYLNNGKFRWWNIGDWELTKREANMTMPEPEQPKYKVGDWVEIESSHVKGKTFVSVIKEMPNQEHYTVQVNGSFGVYTVYGIMERQIVRKLKPSEIIVRIGCLSGTVRPVSTNGIHIWLHLIGVDDKIIATIRISSLDTHTRELVESLLEAQEEKQSD